MEQSEKSQKEGEVKEINQRIIHLYTLLMDTDTRAVKTWGGAETRWRGAIGGRDGICNTLNNYFLKGTNIV